MGGGERGIKGGAGWRGGRVGRTWVAVVGDVTGTGVGYSLISGLGWSQSLAIQEQRLRPGDCLGTGLNRVQGQAPCGGAFVWP